MGQGGGLSSVDVARGRGRRSGGANGRVFCVAATVIGWLLGSPVDARHLQALVQTREPLQLVPGVDVVGSKGGHLRVIADESALTSLRESGYAVEVEITDLEAAYAAGIHGPSWGVYHTLAETEAFLHDLHAAYPAITTAPFSLGPSHQGRPIWALKISDNPSLDEDEPEVLIDGLHHAREMMSVETILDFAGFLCAGYDADSEARALVDHREIYLVPVVNPDGMAYNEQTNPSGGGMWRKNRRDNGNGTFGVDLNRNYPYGWGRDDGSSPEPSSNVYRGPSPASEPETQAMIALMDSRRFVTHLSMHSFLAATLIPWGYTGSPAPDDALLRRWASRLSAENGYTVGQPAEVLYLCSGMTTDYAYGETAAKNRIFSGTIEIGGAGFWPAEGEVSGLLAECRRPLVHAVQSAGVWRAVAGWCLEDDDGRIDPGETVALRFAVENRALLDEAPWGVLTIRTDDAYVQLHDAATAVPALAPLDTAWAVDPIRFTVDAQTPQGHALILRGRSTAGDFAGEEPVRLVVGRPPALFFDDFEDGMTAWIGEDSWGPTDERAHSPVTSLTDSPGGSYGTYVNSSVRLAAPVDLSTVSSATLSFWHRHETEESYDHCIVEASPDAGATWCQVGPQYSGTLPTWQHVELPLDEFLGATFFLIRFRLETDVSITGDGWYIDDVMVAGAAGNLPPPAPIPMAPPDGAAVDVPMLSVAIGADPDGDPLTCGFFVYGDSLLTTLVAASGEVAVTDGAGSWAPGLSGQGVFWWRAFAYDGTERSLLSETRRFSTGLGSPEQPDPTGLCLVAFPVPSRGRTVLTFHLPHASSARLTIHDVTGRYVATLADADFPAGVHRVTWDGGTAYGTPCGPAAYAARLSAEGFVSSRVIVRIE